MPKPAAGSNAITTASIMLLVVTFDLIWGLDETFIKSLMLFFPPISSSPPGLLFLLCKLHFAHGFDHLRKGTFGWAYETAAPALTAFHSVIFDKCLFIVMLCIVRQLPGNHPSRTYLHTFATVDTRPRLHSRHFVLSKA